MLSIFAADLSQPLAPAPYTSGPVFTADAISLVQALAAHHDMGFDEIGALITDVLPHSKASSQSPAGWLLFAQHVAGQLPSPTPDFRPSVH